MVDIFEKDIHLAWYPDEIIGRPGDLKSQMGLEISRDETCEESAHLLFKKDEHDMDVFDALLYGRSRGAEVCNDFFER